MDLLLRRTRPLPGGPVVVMTTQPESDPRKDAEERHHCKSLAVDGNRLGCLNKQGRALNSAVECHPHTVEVIGSNPIAPTILYFLPAHSAIRARSLLRIDSPCGRVLRAIIYSKR